MDAPVVLVLCGLIGSGKSSFAKSLEQHLPIFKRCNQDDLGDRRKVERKARECLAQGYSICIDRTNFDEQQRAHWVRIAREYHGTRLWCLNFQVPKETCAERLASRTNHPTITSLDLGLSVLDRVEVDFVPPSFEEGFDKIHSITRTSSSYTSEEIIDILESIRNSPSPISSAMRFFRMDDRNGHSTAHRANLYSPHSIQGMR